MESYYRSNSPGRRIVTPGRSSTGNISYYPSYESYYLPRNSRDSGLDPRASADRIIGPTRLGSVRDSRNDPPLRRRYDDYVVPIRRALPPLSVPRGPLSVTTAVSPSLKYRPVVSSAIEKPSSPFIPRPREDESFYIQPATTSSRREHQPRNFSADGPEGPRYLDPRGDPNERLERATYRNSGIGGSRMIYNQPLPLVRQPTDKDDDDFGYEYTNMKDQVYRDTAPRPRARRESGDGRRERPLSLSGLEDFLPRTSTLPRDSGPPVTMRGFDKIGPLTTRKEYRFPREPDASREAGKREDQEGLQRRRSARQPVALHQDLNDGYSSAREDRRDSHSHHRTGSLERGSGGGLGIRVPQDQGLRRSTLERPRGSDKEYHDRGGRRYDHDRTDREDSRERRAKHEHRREKPRDHKLAEGLALGAGATAAAGLAAEGMKYRPSDLDDEISPRDKSYNREPDRRGVGLDSAEGGNREGDSDVERRERRRRRKEKEDEGRRRESFRDEGRGRVDDLASKDERRLEPGSYERNIRYPIVDPRVETDDGRRHRRHHQKTSDVESYSSVSEDERGRDYKLSKIRVVSPAKEPEAKPKGILRPPRPKFPEDPAPVREGVAPLKDPAKKGIPPNARWTRIKRSLVNPEALEQGNERFEEREDSVIVLRVLSTEEIEAYAKRTQEIRDARYLQAMEEDERMRQDKPKALADHAYNEPQAPPSEGTAKPSPKTSPKANPKPLQPSGSPDGPLKEGYQRKPPPPRQEFPPPPRPDFPPPPRQDYPPPPPPV